MLVVRKELELMTHSWIQAPYSFPDTLSRAEDTKTDETWLHCSWCIQFRGLCRCGLVKISTLADVHTKSYGNRERVIASLLGVLRITKSSKEEIMWELKLQDKLLVQSQSVENTWLWSAHPYMGHLYQSPAPAPGSGNIKKDGQKECKNQKMCKSAGKHQMLWSQLRLPV